MHLNGIRDLIRFLNYLDKESIHYRLDHLRDDSIMVSFTLVGARVELDFFDAHVEFSYFQGTEAVETDTGLLDRLIQEHWGGRLISVRVSRVVLSTFGHGSVRSSGPVGTASQSMSFTATIHLFAMRDKVHRK